MRISWRPRLATIAMLGVLACGVARAQTASAPAGAPGTASAAARTAVGPVPGPGTGPPRPANPFADDRVAIQEGRRLFLWYNCYGCHGGRAGGGMGPSLRDVDWLYGAADDQIYASIADGRGQGMPAWGTKLPAEQIWKLVAYIRSLRTSAEPQAPKPYEQAR